MAYLSSNNIAVFPCSNRGQGYNLGARLTSEYNLTNIVNQLLNVEAFVISPSYGTSISTDTSISFNILGYYFNVASINDILDLFKDENPEDIYACIRVNTFTTTKSGETLNLQELTTLDSTTASDANMNVDLDTVGESGSSVFMGVQFTKTNPSVSDDVTSYLHILHYDGDTWNIPEDSYIKFTSNNSTRAVTIDDGELSN